MSTASMDRLTALQKEAARTQEEQCALLTGRVNASHVAVSDVVGVRNVARSNAAFSIDADDFRRVDGGEWPVVAVFHTHHASARVSREDKRLLTRSPLVQLVGSPVTAGSRRPHQPPFDLRAYATCAEGLCHITIEVHP